MRSMRLKFCVLIFMAIPISCSKPKESHVALPQAPYINLSRLDGDWHIPARIPTIIDRDATDMRIRVKSNGAGEMRLTWMFKKPDAPEDTSWNLTSKLATENSTTSWVVSPIWPIKFNYQVIDYSADYSWLVLGSSDRRHLWVLARNKDLAPELLNGLLDRLKASDFDMAAVIKEKINMTN